MPPYEFLDHTADILVQASGRNLEEAFEEAARALFDVLTDTRTVNPAVKHSIVLASDSLDCLLVDFLSELLLLFESQELVFSKFEVTLDGTSLHAVAEGERFDPERHRQGRAVKAITYHELEVNRKENRVKVLFDI